MTEDRSEQIQKRLDAIGHVHKTFSGGQRARKEFDRHAPEDITWLLAENERLAAEVERLSGGHSFQLYDASPEKDGNGNPWYWLASCSCDEWEVEGVNVAGLRDAFDEHVMAAVSVPQPAAPEETQT